MEELSESEMSDEEISIGELSISDEEISDEELSIYDGKYREIIFHDDTVIKIQRWRDFYGGIREAIFYNSLDHPNIIKAKKITIEKRNYKNKYNEEVEMTFDKYETYTKPFKMEERKVEKLFREMVDAISYLDMNEILHSDIKHQNIYYDEKNDRFLLADFDISLYKRESFSNRLATDIIQPPELAILRYRRYQNMKELPESKEILQTCKGEVFSLAMTITNLLLGEYWYSIILHEQVDFKKYEIQRKKILPRIKHFKYYHIIEKSLNFDPSLRPSIQEIAKMINSDKIYTSCKTIPRDDFKLYDIIEEDIKDYKSQSKLEDIKVQDAANIFTTFYSLKGVGPKDLLDYALTMNASITITCILSNLSNDEYYYILDYFIFSDMKYFTYEEGFMPFNKLFASYDRSFEHFEKVFDGEYNNRTIEVCEMLDFKLLF